MTQANAWLQYAEKLYVDYDFEADLKLVQHSVAEVEIAEDVRVL